MGIDTQSHSSNMTMSNSDINRVIENQRIIINDLQLIKSKLFNF